MQHRYGNGRGQQAGSATPFLLGLALCAIAALVLAGTEPYEHGYTRTAEVATAMVASHDWIVQRFSDGGLYFDKPPLFTWLIALPIAATGGVVSWQQHVPGLLAFALSLLWTGLLAQRLLGTRRAGVAAALVLATSWGFPALIRTKRLDPIFAAWVTGTLYFAWTWLHGERPGERDRAAVAAWLLLALAVLTKGPFALLIALLSVGLYAAWSGRARRLATRGAALGALLFLAVVAIWPILLVRRLGLTATTDALHSTRLVTDYGGPLLYLMREPQLLLPWLLFTVPLLIWRGRGASNPSRDAIRFLLCWLAAVVIPLHLSPAKSPRYMLPAFPPLAILVAGVWEGFELDALAVRWRDRLLLVLLGVAAAAAVVAPVVILTQGRRSPIGPLVALPLLVPLALVSVAGLRALRRGEGRGGFAWAALAVALAFGVHALVVAGDYARKRGPGRELLTLLAPALQGEELRTQGLDAERRRIAVLATGGLVTELESEPEVAAWLRDAPGGHGLLLTRAKHADVLARDGSVSIESRTPLVVDKRDLEVLELRAVDG